MKTTARAGHLAAAAAGLLALPGTALADLNLKSRLSTSGLGPVKIGMTVSQAEEAAGYSMDVGQLDGAGPADGMCFSGQLVPRRYGAFVLGTGFRVAVISTNKRSLATRQGIRVGDSVPKLLRTYTALESKPRFYAPSSLQYELHRGNRKIIFSTDNKNVLFISVGRKPEINYVEGCA